MSIRNALETDLADLARCLVETQKMHVEAYPDVYKPISMQDAKDFLTTRFSNNTFYTRIAEKAGNFAGCSLFELKKVESSLFRQSRSFVYLSQITVDTTYKRTGIGNELIKDLYQIVKDLGIKRIELDVWNFNQQAYSFFRKQGFELFGNKLSYSL